MVATDDPLRTIFTAVRTHYSPNNQFDIAYEEYFEYLNSHPTEEKQKDLPDRMVEVLVDALKRGNLGALEHVNFTFGIRCASRIAIEELTKQKSGFGYNVQSQNHVRAYSSDGDLRKFEYIIPESIVENKELREQYHVLMSQIKEFYDQAVEEVPLHEARYVLPNAILSNVTITVNLRAFIDFYLEHHEDVKNEVRDLVRSMKDEILKYEPGLQFLFKAVEGKI